MSSDYSNSYSITTNTHAGAICDAHQFDQYEDCSDAGRCLTDFPYNGESNSPYCESLKVTSISGELDNGVCTCKATVSSDDGLYTETKSVWSSECIENLYVYDIGPDGDGTGTQPSLLLPCSFTG